MNNVEWNDLHNEANDDETGKDIVQVEVEWGNSVVYECKVEVQTYRNIPCNSETISMTRSIFNYDGDGSEVHSMELDLEDFPHFISRAAEKKALRML